MRFSRPAHRVVEIRQTGERFLLGEQWGEQEAARRYARILAISNEATGEIRQLNKTVGADGKERPARKGNRFPALYGRRTSLRSIVGMPGIMDGARCVRIVSANYSPEFTAAPGHDRREPGHLR